MEPLHEYHELFGASVGAAAALAGLLFVAISISPEQTFGAGADAARRAQAEFAFTALANVFFVSLAALLPRSSLGAIAVCAILAMLQIFRVGISDLRSHGAEYNWSKFGFISLGIYALEFYLTVRLMHGADVNDGLVWVVFGLYGYALGAAWGLLGGRRTAKKS